jgi:hypothetical protein
VRLSLRVRKESTPKGVANRVVGIGGTRAGSLRQRGARMVFGSPYKQVIGMVELLPHSGGRVPGEGVAGNRPNST